MNISLSNSMSVISTGLSTFAFALAWNLHVMSPFIPKSLGLGVIELRLQPVKRLISSTNTHSNDAVFFIPIDFPTPFPSYPMSGTIPKQAHYITKNIYLKQSSGGVKLSHLYR